jgi:hypothetical protein
MNDITQILNAIDSGDPEGSAALLPLVYAELRKLAAARLAGEQRGQTLFRRDWFTKPTCDWSARRVSRS